MGITRQGDGPVTLAPSDLIIHPCRDYCVAFFFFLQLPSLSTHVLTIQFQLFYFPAVIGSTNPMHPHPLLTPHFLIHLILYAQLPFNFQKCLSPLPYLLLGWVLTHFGHTVLVQPQHDRSQRQRHCHCHFVKVN